MIQHRAGHVAVLEELRLPDTKTDSAVTAFLDLAADRDWDLTNLHIYGDATGTARDSTSGTSDWTIVRNRLAHVAPHLKVPRANPAIKQTINAINAKLKAADGAARLTIAPKCRGLIDDLRSALWPSDKMMHDQHALAWLRYFVHREYPIKLDVKRDPGTIGFAG